MSVAESAFVQRTLRRAVLLPVAVAVIAGLIFLFIIRWLLAETDLLRHSEEVIATAELSRQLAVDMETGVRGFLLTRDPRFLEPRIRASAELPKLLERLSALVADNPEQVQRVATIAHDVAQWRLYADESLKADPAGRNLFSGKTLMDRVRDDHDQLLAAERSLLTRRAANVHDTTLIAIGLTFAVALIAGAILVFFIRRQLQQVRVSYERALDGAEESLHAKDRLLATVSHELRTPLTSILGWSSLLRATDFDEEMKALALTSIEQSARLQARLIEDLLDVSRMAAGKLRIDMAPMDLRDALTAACDTMRPAAEAKGVSLNIDIDGEPMRILGDPTRLQQVFWNLISNAVRFTPPAGRIDASAKRESDSIIVRVADTGTGIERDFLPRIFEPFAQQESSARSSSGLGLGLDIARQLVALHGGTITASSEGPGRGAEFIVRLPRAK